MNIFSFIKSHVSIVDVIGEYATLKRAGMYFKGRCPFHHEKTASFTVSPHKEIFYCFGCHLGGDIISFVSKVENCTQIEAARFLADRYSLDVPKEIEVSESNAQEKQHYFHVCELVAHWCHEQLYKNPSVLAYLYSRGFTKESIDSFSIGYFPGGLTSIKTLSSALQKHNILLDDLVEAHIVERGKTVMYSPFEDRIIFPIKDHLGRNCAFGGRIFKPHDTRAKYYNSRENNYFIKGSLLFGLDSAKKSIQKSERVFLVEGYTDCIAMVQHGYTATVATLGTACTINHLKHLNRYAHRVYMVYDADAAGEQAVLRLTQLCWQANMELMVVTLPAGQDPASYLHAGNDLNPLIEHAKDIFLFYIETLGRGFSIKPLHEKVQLTRALIEIIRGIDDELKQDFLLQRAAKTFDIPFQSLKNELVRAGAPDAPSEEGEPDIDIATVPALEKQVFCAIMHNVELLKTMEDNYIIATLPEPLNKIVEQLWQRRDENSFDFSLFFDSLKQDERHYVSKFLLEQEKPVEQDVFEQLIQQLYRKRWKTIVLQIKEHLAAAKQEKNSRKIEKIIAHFEQLKKKILPTIHHKP